MADEIDKSGAQGARRFRLPKLFADAEGAAEGMAEVSPAMPSVAAAESPGAGALDVNVAAFHAPGATGYPLPHPPQEPARNETMGDEILEYVAGMAQELLSLREKISHVAEAIDDFSARESTQEKVFDTLHAELGAYKKDFIYEHLKPVVRPLLFLYDSLEQFDGEIEQYQRPGEEERRGLSPQLVRQNVVFFRDQLVEALRVCEVTMMEPPTGAFNPKMQKPVGVQKVEPAEDNTIVRVVRSGWFLNGQMLRPAEVVVGKAAK